MAKKRTRLIAIDQGQVGKRIIDDVKQDFPNLSDTVRPKPKQQGWLLVKGDHSYLMEDSLYIKPLLGNPDLHSSFLNIFILPPYILLLSTSFFHCPLWLRQKS